MNMMSESIGRCANRPLELNNCLPDWLPAHWMLTKMTNRLDGARRRRRRRRTGGATFDGAAAAVVRVRWHFVEYPPQDRGHAPAGVDHNSGQSFIHRLVPFQAATAAFVRPKRRLRVRLRRRSTALVRARRGRRRRGRTARLHR